ncbi:MAG: acyltransferase family protein [Alphaproteobacteria bacterium]|nr:acyltransferase family protein [Alphaproteobacteria bacterium]
MRTESFVSSEPVATSKYRPEIDGLRAVAVTAVIVNHFNRKLLPNGYLGVDIFFVISGFVITLSMLNNYKQMSFLKFIAAFISRRVRRLVPALVVCIALTGLFVWIFDHSPATSLRTGIASLFGLSNIYLAHEATDYFAPSSAINAFTQTWSLGVEEQFYLIFPVIMYLTFVRSHKSDITMLLVVVAFLSILSLFGFVAENYRSSIIAYFMIPFRFWELGVGVVVALTIRDNSTLDHKNRFNDNIAFVLLLFSLFMFPHTGTVALTIVAVTMAGLLIYFIHSGSIIYRILSYPPVVYIGRISYSLYLWHWSVLSVSRITIGVDIGTAALQILLILLLAIGSYKYVELPFRHRKQQRVNFNPIIASFFVQLIAAGLLTVFLVNRPPFHIYSKNIRYIPDEFSIVRNNGLPYDPTCVVDNKTRLLTIAKFDLCTSLPREGSTQMIWTLGDSHAGHLLGLLYSTADKTGVGVHLIETPGVPFPVPPGQAFEPRNIIFNEIMNRAHPGDILLISRLFFEKDPPYLPVGGLNEWAAQVESLSDLVSPHGLNIVIVAPTPIFHFDSITQCGDTWFHTSPCDIERSVFAGNVNAVTGMLDTISNRKKNVFVFDVFDILCDSNQQKCSPVKAGVPLFRDKDHLNPYGSAFLSDEFVKFLRKNKLLE